MPVFLVLHQRTIGCSYASGLVSSSNPQLGSTRMTKKKIYVAVVDDDDSFARALCRLLRASGFEVLRHASGEAFLAAAQDPRPDCLVLDVQLGGMSGLELQQRLLDLDNPTPVIFVTAHDAPEIRRKALEVGCVAYLRKPVAKVSLMEAIAKALHPDGPS
jgi:FixJ family two-component response regulator